MRALICLALYCLAIAHAAPDPRESEHPRTFHLPPGKHEQAVEFHRQLNALRFAAVAWDAAVLIVMVRRRTGPRVRDAVRRIPWRFARDAAIVAVLLAIPWFADIPLAAYRHWLGMKYGLSIQPWLPWLADVLKAGLVTGIPAALLLTGGLALARRSPRRWWLYAWGASVITMIAATYLMPLVVDPLFFNFHPLSRTNPQLTAAVQKVAARAGYDIPPERIFEMDASTKTRAVNAYITGFGHSRRIVIWDTTVAALNTPQVQTVFAHELGHYALNHIPRSIALGAAGLLLLFWILFRSIEWAVRNRGVCWAIHGPADPGILPFALLVVLVLSFIAEPLANTYSRWQEHQADVYELEAMYGLVPNPGENSAGVNQIMGEIDLDDPDPAPFIRFWLYSHPPTNERMIFAQRYHPWSQGRPMRYLSR